MSRLRQLDARRIAGYRLAAGGLAQRSAPGNASLRQAAHAGLQDSWPRAALLSVHARVEQAEAAGRLHTAAKHSRQARLVQLHDQVSARHRPEDFGQVRGQTSGQ